MARASEGRSKRRGLARQKGYRNPRPVGDRPTLSVVIVACEDSVTAPNYFEELKRLVKRFVTVKVLRPSGGETSPEAVVKRAFDAYEREPRSNEDERDTAWAVIDTECDDERRKQAENARKKTKSKHVQVVLSEPCFEVWTLLHLEDTGASFIDCAQVFDRLKRLWKDRFDLSIDSKTQIDSGKIIGERHEACKRAKKHHENNDPSWTEVYKIINAIELLDPESGSGVA